MQKQRRNLYLLCLVIFFCLDNLFAQGPDTLWTKTYGGVGRDVGWTAQQTSDGGYILAGWTYSFGAGETDVYLVKTDANGDTLWTRIYGGTSWDEAFSIQQTSDGGYIIAGRTFSFGAGASDVYLMKTDSNGDTLWTKTYGGKPEDKGNSVQQTSDGGYIVAGMTSSFGAGLGDVYLLKSHANGDTLWTKTYGGVDVDGGNSVQQTSDDGYIIAGDTRSFGVGGHDLYLIKTDADGDTLWTRTYGGEYWDEGHSIQQTSDGGYIVAGQTTSFGAGSRDVYLVKIDANGDTLWTRAYGGTGEDRGYSVIEASDGGYVVVGWTDSFGAGGRDVYLIKADANGDTVWTKTYGGTDMDRGWSIQHTSDGGYIIGGSTFSFGAGNEDAYLIKTEADVGIEETEPSQVASLFNQSKPNPFKNKISIQYRLPEISNVHIVIYNLLGQEIRTLTNNKENAGTHTISWHGIDNLGRKVTNGVYFCKMQIQTSRGTGNYVETAKIILLK